MNKKALLIIIVGLIVGVGIILFSGKKVNENKETISSVSNISNVEVKDGIQYITIDVKGGYLPRISSAKSGIPTKLIMKTSGTYDCSASLVIRSIGYHKILPNRGEEIIDIGIPQVDKPILGVCGMGMYNFLINFK